ncbi:hypothetical protein ACO1O0_009294 [Amphichorda felina]
MASHRKITIRKKRTSSLHLSSENPSKPIGPQDAAPGEQETPHSAEITTAEVTGSDVNGEKSSDDSGGLKQVSSSSELGTGSDIPCVKTVCKKHMNQVECEKTKCLKATSKGTPESPENSKSPAQDISDSSSSRSSKGKNKGKKKEKKRKLKISKSSSSTPTDAESSETTNNEASTSASTPPAESSSFETEVQTSEDAATAGDESGWTLSEDHLLRGMKEDSRQLTWVEIAKVLRRDKKDVQGRWKAIKDQPHHRDMDEEDRDEAGLDTAQPKQKRKQKDKSSKTKQETNPTNKNVSKWHKGKHNTRVIAENKIAKSRAASKAAAAAYDAPILSGEEPSSDPDPDPDSDHDDLGYGPCDERRRQVRYLHRQVYAGLYPPTLSPRPDDYFGLRDCEVLATVESRYMRAKWLEMQANFYNVTGRMIPLDLIRDKCERAQAEEESAQRREHGNWESGEGVGGADGRKKVERWVSGVDQENLDDPDL